MWKRKLNNNIEQNGEISGAKQNNIPFDEEWYYSWISVVETEKKKWKNEKEQKIKWLKKILLEDDDSKLLDKIDSSVFENVVNSEELKDICKKSIKNWMLKFDENGKIVGVYIEVWWEKRPSNLFESLIDGWFSPEQALKSRLQVRTESFKKWFGDRENNPSQASKIVDKNGEPLVMWHWTIANFNEFKHQASKNFKSIWNTSWRFYFAESKNFVRQYTSLKRKTIIDMLKNVEKIEKTKDPNATWNDVAKLYNEIIESIDSDEDCFSVDDYWTVYYKDCEFIPCPTNVSSYSRFHAIGEWNDAIEFDDFKKWNFKFTGEDWVDIQLNDIYLPKSWVDWKFIPCFIRWNNVLKYNLWVDGNESMDWAFDELIEKGDNNTDVIIYDTTDVFKNDWIKIWVRDAVQIKSAIDNDWTFSSEEWKFNDYFWKRAKLTTWIDSRVVYENQSKINTILSSDKTIEEKNQELSEYISEQYFNIMWENLLLTESQLESIIKSYGIKWTIWRLSLDKLKQKNEILSETITDPKIRRFLLESGLC